MQLDGVKEDLSSGRSRPSDNGGGGGEGGHPDPQVRGDGLPKNFFRSFGPQF